MYFLDGIDWMDGTEGLPTVGRAAFLGVCSGVGRLEVAFVRLAHGSYSSEHSSAFLFLLDLGSDGRSKLGRRALIGREYA